MAESEYKISLITPVYNAERYIQEAFESVKSQTIGFENIEWLLADDCSTDASFEMISAWAKEHPNIKVLRTPANTGTPAGSRNVGLDHASAPYVMFLDNDDVLCPDAMQALYDEIEKTGADIVTGDAVLLNAREFSKKEAAPLLIDTRGLENGRRELRLPFDDWIYPYLNNHWCKIYRREIIERNQIRALAGELWEDILFLFLYMSCVKTMVHIPQTIVRYRVRRESLSHVYDGRFYGSLPRSIVYGFREAGRMGEENASVYAALVKAGEHVEYYTDKLLDSESLTDEELAECLTAWGEVYRKSVEYGTEFHSAYCKILADDFVRGDTDRALFHFFTLKELYKQRKTEKNNILNSTTFKLAKRLSDAKEHIFCGRR